jgi:hypothetical protein
MYSLKSYRLSRITVIGHVTMAAGPGRLGPAQMPSTWPFTRKGESRSFASEHMVIENAGSLIFRRVHVKTTLGAGLLRFGNKAEDPYTYSAMYEESERILLSRLWICSPHTGQRNKTWRWCVEIGFCVTSRKEGAMSRRQGCRLVMAKKTRSREIPATALLTYDEALARAALARAGTGGQDRHRHAPQETCPGHEIGGDEGHLYLSW